LGAVRLGWYPGCRLKRASAGNPDTKASASNPDTNTSAGNPDTTPAEPHPNSNTQQTKNETANIVVQQYSRILLKMGILMPETC